MRALLRLKHKTKVAAKTYTANLILKKRTFAKSNAAGKEGESSDSELFQASRDKYSFFYIDQVNPMKSNVLRLSFFRLVHSMPAGIVLVCLFIFFKIVHDRTPEDKPIVPYTDRHAELAIFAGFFDMEMVLRKLIREGLAYELIKRLSKKREQNQIYKVGDNEYRMKIYKGQNAGFIKIRRKKAQTQDGVQNGLQKDFNPKLLIKYHDGEDKAKEFEQIRIVDGRLEKLTPRDVGLALEDKNGENKKKSGPFLANRENEIENEDSLQNSRSIKDAVETDERVKIGTSLKFELDFGEFRDQGVAEISFGFQGFEPEDEMPRAFSSVDESKKQRITPNTLRYMLSKEKGSEDDSLPWNREIYYYSEDTRALYRNALDTIFSRKPLVKKAFGGQFDARIERLILQIKQELLLSEDEECFKLGAKLIENFYYPKRVFEIVHRYNIIDLLVGNSVTFGGLIAKKNAKAIGEYYIACEKHNMKIKDAHMDVVKHSVQNFAVECLEKGIYRECEYWIKVATKLLPHDMNNLSIMFSLYMADGREEKAVQIMRKMIRKAPKSAELKFNLASQVISHSKVNDKAIREAINILKGYIMMKNAPDASKAFHAISDILIKRKRYEEAITYLTKLTQSSTGFDDASAHLKLAKCHLQSNPIDQKSIKMATKSFKCALNLEPQDSRTRLKLCICLSKLGKYRESLKNIETLLQENEYSDPALFLYAKTLRKMKRPNEALKRLRLISNMREYNAQELYLKGELLMDLNKDRESREIFETTLKVLKKSKRKKLIERGFEKKLRLKLKKQIRNLNYRMAKVGQKERRILNSSI